MKWQVPQGSSSSQHPKTPPPFEVGISGIGLECVWGNQPFALLGAVGTGLSGGRVHPVLSFPVPGSDREAPALTAPVQRLEGIESSAERMRALGSSALEQACKALSESVSASRILVHTLVSLEHPIEVLEPTLRKIHPLLQSAEFRWSCPGDSASSVLYELCKGLEAKEWDIILFGGIDTLVSASQCTELAAQQKILTAQSSDGVIPGEAAAYLILQNSATETRTSICQGAIAGIGFEQVTVPGAPLGSAIRAACAQAQTTPAQIDSIVVPLGAEVTGALEWYRTVHAMWPLPKGTSRTENLPPLAGLSGKEEWRPWGSLGELGAATVPVSLALACARFEYQEPLVQQVLVCEAGSPAWRGAICLLVPLHISEKRHE